MPAGSMTICGIGGGFQLRRVRVVLRGIALFGDFANSASFLAKATIF